MGVRRMTTFSLGLGPLWTACCNGARAAASFAGPLVSAMLEASGAAGMLQCLLQGGCLAAGFVQQAMLAAQPRPPHGH